MDFESVRASRAASSYDAARRAFTAEGVPPSDASGYARYAVEPRLFDASRLELVASCDGDAIEVGRYRFRVVETPGHTPGHLALYEPESRILFGGDHVLFVISPSIALFPDGADGLQAYLDSLDKVVEHLIVGGVDGLFALGSSGEVAYLTDSQRDAVIERVVKKAAGRVPVLAGAIDTTAHRVIEQARRAVSLGAQAIVATCPFYALNDADEIKEHFRAIAKAVDVPVFAYDVPVRLGGAKLGCDLLVELGKEGVLALLADSTNVERPGFTKSERSVGDSFDALFRGCQQRIIVTTFASNVDRVQQIINSAYKYNRKVVVEGRSMVNIIDTAMNLGCLNIPENTLITVDQLKNYPDERTAIITTGSQGETMAALSRMAASTHRKVSIKPGDVIIFSSHPIPGNEKAVSKV